MPFPLTRPCPSPLIHSCLPSLSSGPDSLFFCDQVCFPYLDTVEPEDGGLVVLCGSHKTQLARSAHHSTLFQSPEWAKLPGERAPPAGVAHVCPDAGDFVIMPEATVRFSSFFCINFVTLPYQLCYSSVSTL